MKAEFTLRIRPKVKIFKGYPDFTPFACVFFLLLFFFIMGSAFVPVSGIPVDLPETKIHRTYNVKKFVVTVDQTGKIYFNDQPVNDIEKLKEYLVARVVNTGTADEPGGIVIRADTKSGFGTVARIMSLAEELRLNVFILALPAAETTQKNFTDTEK